MRDIACWHQVHHGVWISFALLTFLHVLTNLAALRTLALRDLNLVFVGGMGGVEGWREGRRKRKEESKGTL